MTQTRAYIVILSDRAQAVAHGDDYIGTEHFLLALLCHRDAPVVQALASLGAEENEVRAAITAQRAESGPERPT